MTRARDLSNLIGSGNYTSTTFTATAGQTVFTIAHTQGFIQVFMNGLLLDETTDYTSNGTAVTLTEAATAGDELEVVKYNTFSVGDAITQTDADTRYVNASGDTMTGDLAVTGGNVGVGTSSPLGPLHIEGNTNEYATAPVVYFGSTSTASSEIRDWAIGPADNNYGNFHIFRGVATGTNAVGSQEIVVTIDSAGRVTMPYQPAFYAGGGSAGAQTNGTIITAWSERYDRGNNHSNGRFTAPVSGFYAVSFGVRSINTSATIYAQCWKNGSGAPGISAVEVLPGMATEHHRGGGYLYLAANDYVEIYAGSNVHIDNSDHFAVTLLS